MASHPSPREIVIFFTGGTICMRLSAKNRGVVPGEDFERFFRQIDRHMDDVQLRAVQWSNLPSPHMTPEMMFGLAREVDRALERPHTAGAVVIHGTDVLVESAFMAELVMRSAKPVVYTGSMRFYSETGYDGIRNLLNSVRACLLPLPASAGVVLLMTDRLFSARHVVKINSMNIDAFEAPENGPIGYVAGDSVILTRPHSGDMPPDRPRIPAGRIETRVPLIACYTGMGTDMIDSASSGGAAGLVLEGFGAGNVPPAIVPALETHFLKKDLPVVLTTQCPEGGVWPIYGYPGGGADLAERGVILGGRLSGAKARIQLMAALGAAWGPGEIRRIFADRQ